MKAFRAAAIKAAQQQQHQHGGGVSPSGGPAAGSDFVVSGGGNPQLVAAVHSVLGRVSDIVASLDSSFANDVGVVDTAYARSPNTTKLALEGLLLRSDPEAVFFYVYYAPPISAAAAAADGGESSSQIQQLSAGRQNDLRLDAGEKFAINRNFRGAFGDEHATSQQHETLAGCIVVSETALPVTEAVFRIIYVARPRTVHDQFADVTSNSNSGNNRDDKASSSAFLDLSVGASPASGQENQRESGVGAAAPLFNNDSFLAAPAALVNRAFLAESSAAAANAAASAQNALMHGAKKQQSGPTSPVFDFGASMSMSATAVPSTAAMATKSLHPADLLSDVYVGCVAQAPIDYFCLLTRSLVTEPLEALAAAQRKLDDRALAQRFELRHAGGGDEADVDAASGIPSAAAARHTAGGANSIGLLRSTGGGSGNGNGGGLFGTTDATATLASHPLPDVCAFQDVLTAESESVDVLARRYLLGQRSALVATASASGGASAGSSSSSTAAGSMMMLKAPSSSAPGAALPPGVSPASTLPDADRALAHFRAQYHVLFDALVEATQHSAVAQQQALNGVVNQDAEEAVDAAVQGLNALFSSVRDFLLDFTGRAMRAARSIHKAGSVPPHERRPLVPLGQRQPSSAAAAAAALAAATAASTSSASGGATSSSAAAAVALSRSSPELNALGGTATGNSIALERLRDDDGPLSEAYAWRCLLLDVEAVDALLAASAVSELRALLAAGAALFKQNNALPEEDEEQLRREQAAEQEQLLLEQKKHQQKHHLSVADADDTFVPSDDDEPDEEKQTLPPDERRRRNEQRRAQRWRDKRERKLRAHRDAIASNPAMTVGAQCDEYIEVIDPELAECRAVMGQQRGEAADALKHLAVAEPAFRDLHAASFAELPEAMRAAMGQIRALTLLVTFYAEPPHVERMLLLLVYEVISVCKQNLQRDGRLWERCLRSRDLNEVLSQLALATDAADTLRTHFLQYFPPSEAAALDSLVVFGSLDLFQRRLAKLRDMCLLAQTYVALSESRLDSVDFLVAQFKQCFQDLQRRCGNPFDHTKPMFDRDFAEFRVAVSDLDCELMLYCNSAYETRTTTLSALHLMERLDGLLGREVLRADFQSKFFQLIQRFTSEIEVTMRAFEHGKENPPTPRGSGPVSGRILWARHLYRMIAEPMALFEKIDANFRWGIIKGATTTSSQSKNVATAGAAAAASADSGGAFAATTSASSFTAPTPPQAPQPQQHSGANVGIVKKTLRYYNRAASALIEYEQWYVGAWLRSVEVTRTALQATVFIKEQLPASVVQGRYAGQPFSVGEFDDLTVAATAASTAALLRPYSVNFDPALWAMWADARWLTRLGISHGYIVGDGGLGSGSSNPAKDDVNITTVAAGAAQNASARDKDKEGGSLKERQRERRELLALIHSDDYQAGERHRRDERRARMLDIEQQRGRIAMCVARLRLLLDAAYAIRKTTPPELFYVVAPRRTAVEDKIDLGSQSFTWMSSGLLQYIEEAETMAYRTLDTVTQAREMLHAQVLAPIAAVAKASLLAAPADALAYVSTAGGAATFVTQAAAGGSGSGGALYEDPAFGFDDDDGGGADGGSSAVLTPMSLAARCKSIMDGVVAVARCFISKWAPNEPPPLPASAVATAQLPLNNVSFVSQQQQHSASGLEASMSGVMSGGAAPKASSGSGGSDRKDPVVEMWIQLQKFYLLMHNQLQRAVLTASTRSLLALKRRIGSRPAPHLFRSDGSLKVVVFIELASASSSAAGSRGRNAAGAASAAAGGGSSFGMTALSVVPWGTPGAGVTPQFGSQSSSSQHQHSPQQQSRASLSAQRHSSVGNTALTSAPSMSSMRRYSVDSSLSGSQHLSGSFAIPRAASVSAAPFDSDTGGDRRRSTLRRTASSLSAAAMQQQQRGRLMSDLGSPGGAGAAGGATSAAQVLLNMRRQQEADLDALHFGEGVRFIDQIRAMQQRGIKNALAALDPLCDASLYGPSFIAPRPALDDLDRALSQQISGIITAAKRVKSWPAVPNMHVAVNPTTGALEADAHLLMTQQHHHHHHPADGAAHKKSVLPGQSVSPSGRRGASGAAGAASSASGGADKGATDLQHALLPAFSHKVSRSAEVMKQTLVIAGCIYALKQEVVRTTLLILDRFLFLLTTDRRLVVDSFMKRFDFSTTAAATTATATTSDSSASSALQHRAGARESSSGNLPVTEVLLEVQALDALERELTGGNGGGIASAPETFLVGSVLLDFRAVLAGCTREVRAWRAEFVSRFLSVVGRRLDALTHTVQSLARRLDDGNGVTPVTQVCATMRLLRQARLADEETTNALSSIGRALDAFETYDPRRVHELVDACLEVRKKWEREVRPLASRRHDMMQSLQQFYRQEAALLAQLFSVDLHAFRNSFLTEGPAAPGVSPAEAMLRLKRYGRALEERKLQWENLHELEGILNLPQRKYPELARTFIEAEQLRALYELYDEVTLQTELWSRTPWRRINVVELGECVGEMQGRVRRLPAAVKEWTAFTQMKRTLDELAQAVPVLESLASKAVRDRHWAEVMKVTGTTWDNSDPDAVLLQQILDANPARFREEIVDIAGSSEKEAEIESKLRALALDWKGRPLVFAEHKNRGLITLKGEETSALKDALDESLLALSAMLASRYSVPFKSEVNTWLSKLGQTQEALTLWVEVQSLWAYLEAVFSGGDIMRQLPQDAKRFAMIDKQWCKIFVRAVEVVSVIDFCVGNDLLKGLPYLQGQMALCQKSLAAYLEQKRGFFPRFYFVSDSVLLEMLAQGSDPLQLQAHLLSVFDGVAAIDVETKSSASANAAAAARTRAKQQQQQQQSSSSAPQQQQQHHGGGGSGGALTRIVAVRNTADERLELLEDVPCVGNIEAWLLDLLGETHRAVRQVMRSALQDAQDIMSNPGAVLKKFLFDYPAQIVLTVIQMVWTSDLTAALSATGPNRQARRLDTSKKLQAMREVLAEAAKTLVDSAHKQIHLQNVTGVVVHGQDVWEGTVRRCRDASSFDWLRQLRTYWTERQSAQLQLTDTSIAFCDEFLDLHERLVVTDLTDRCYITLAQALAMHMGGAPAGPAGTGKTETVKDLARAAAKMAVVVNCSDQWDVRSLSKMFKGLAASGSWGCFDEFNRITLPVLSVVAQQVSTILVAMRHKRSEFMFVDGTSVPLNHHVGIFVTMNPTYAGRQELPENLKAILRGVSMMVPDQQAIMQVRLASSGYKDDSGLAHRFYMLYSLAGQQLSKQPHYDWGLRSTLSVLRAAGDALRRTVMQQSALAAQRRREEQLAQRAARSTRRGGGNSSGSNKPGSPTAARSSSPGADSASSPTASSSAAAASNFDGGDLDASVASLQQQQSQPFVPVAVDEEGVFVRTLRDMNLSKLTYEDVPVFTSLLSALFPNTIAADAASAYPDLLQALVGSAAELRLEPTPQWGKKALQLYENKCVRHGIMLVGAAGAGKSACLAALLRALRDYERSRCREVRLNPKAITTEQLFGRVDPSTGDWYDGVFSSLWRRYNRQHSSSSSSSSGASGGASSSGAQPASGSSSSGAAAAAGLAPNAPPQVFIVCDGPIDTLWVESLNTVLDDNKLLTLANGDRILMAPNVKMCFEAEHLQHASPATVSRAGIVFFSPEDVGPLPLLTAGIRHQEELGAWPAELCYAIHALAERTLEPLILAVERSLRRESSAAPGVNRCHAAWQLLKILVPIITDVVGVADISADPDENARDQKIRSSHSASAASPANAIRKLSLAPGMLMDDRRRNNNSSSSSYGAGATVTGTVSTARLDVARRVFVWCACWAVAGPFGDDEKRAADAVMRRWLPEYQAQAAAAKSAAAAAAKRKQEQEREQLQQHAEEHRKKRAGGGKASPRSALSGARAAVSFPQQPQQGEGAADAIDEHGGDAPPPVTPPLSTSQEQQHDDVVPYLFDVFWDFTSKSWQRWSTVVHAWSATALTNAAALAITGGSVDVRRAFVPTAESVCFDALAALCFVNKVPIALTGTGGSGKSVILSQAAASFTLAGLQAYRGTASTTAQQRQLMTQLRMAGPSTPLLSEGSRTVLTEGALESIQSRGFINSRAYHVSSSSTPGSVQAAVEEMCEKRVGSTYGPRHGHRLFLVIEDLHMAPANEWGDQPAAEFLRQFLERSGHYDLERIGDWKNFVDLQFGATFTSGGGGGGGGGGGDTSAIPPRLRRHFFTLFLSLPPVETLERVCSAMLRARLALLPRCALSVTHADAAVRVLIAVWRAAEKKLLPTPARLFCSFNWRDVTNAMQGLFVCSAACFESVPVFTAALRHELARSMCDKLNLKEDAQWLQQRIVEALVGEAVLTGTSAAVSSDETILCPFSQATFQVPRDGDEDGEEASFSLASAEASLSASAAGSGIFGKNAPSSPSTKGSAAGKNSGAANNASSSSSGAGAAADTSAHLDPSTLTAMRTKLHAALQHFNSTRPRKKTTPHSHEMDLVLFDDSVRHVLRVARALSTPRGNMILMGGAGGGKVSLARLASYCCGPDMLCMQPLPLSSYGLSNFLDDLRTACVHAATKTPVAFILTDADIQSDAFLEPIGALLASGEAPGLFPVDERDSALSAMRTRAKALFGRNLDDSEEHIWSVFVQRVQAHLHFVFCFSLEGGLLASCARRFPSIFRCSVINYVHAWPREALEAVAAARMQAVDEQCDHALSVLVENPKTLAAQERAIREGDAADGDSAAATAAATAGSKQATDSSGATLDADQHALRRAQHGLAQQRAVSVLSAVCSATAKIHDGARALCDEYHRQYRVRVSCCSTHFLTLLSEFATHFRHKNRAALHSMHELRGGLDKMAAAAGDVRAMRATLDKKELLLKEAQVETDALLREIMGTKLDAEQKRQVIASVTDVLARDAAVIDATKVEAETDLLRAQPALNAARAALDQITPNDMKTLKALQKPPEMVRRIFDGVCILFHHPMEQVGFEVAHTRGGKLVMTDSWAKGGRTLATRIDFLDLMLNFNQRRKDQINDETCELLQPYLWQDDFTYERARSASGNVAGLCTWVRAMEQYRVMSKFVAPKREALRQAEAKLRQANQRLRKQREELDRAEQALAACEARFAAGQAKKASLEEDAGATRRRMNYASDLLAALGDENKRWMADYAQLRIVRVRMPACVLACAAVLAYSAPFNSVFRKRLLDDVVAPALASVSMPLPAGFDFCRYLVDSEDVIEGWHLHGLPADRQSVENAVITAMGGRVPIMVDPQEQATTWVKRTIQTMHRQNVARLEAWRAERKAEKERALKRMRDGGDDDAPTSPSSATPAAGATTATASMASFSAGDEEAEMNDPTRPVSLPVPASVAFLSTARQGFETSLEAALPTSSMVVISVDAVGSRGGSSNSITLPSLLDALVKVMNGAQQPWIKATFMAGQDQEKQQQLLDQQDRHKNQQQQSQQSPLGRSFKSVAQSAAASMRFRAAAGSSVRFGGVPGTTSVSRTVHLLGEPYDLHRDFCLMLVSKSAAPDFGPDAFLQGTVVDFRVTEAGLREQLLARVVQYECEELEQRKTNLMKQINDAHTALRVQERGLLQKLSSVEGSLVEDETVILTLAHSKKLAVELKETLATAGKTRANIDEARNQYAVVARRGAAMYFASDEMAKLLPCYVFSLAQFLGVFDRAMRETPPAPDSRERIKALLDEVPYKIFAAVGRGFYEHHKPLFMLLIAARIEMASGALTAHAFSAFLTGGTALSASEALASRPKSMSWISVAVWKHVVALSGPASPFSHLQQLQEAIVRYEPEFRAWAEGPTPEQPGPGDAPLPACYNSGSGNINSGVPQLPIFTQLALVRILREDRVFAAASVALERLLGPRFGEVPAFSLDALVAEVAAAGPATPFMFLLSTGGDPGSAIEAAARRHKKQLLQQSLGQGQEGVAMNAVLRAAGTGGWALLHNAHLSPLFLVRLEEWTSKAEETLAQHRIKQQEKLKQQRAAAGGGGGGEADAAAAAAAASTNAASGANATASPDAAKEASASGAAAAADSSSKDNTKDGAKQPTPAEDNNNGNAKSSSSSSSLSVIAAANRAANADKIPDATPATLLESRLWLTAAPVSDLPVALLQRCIKLTQEPPQGIRATAQRTCSLVSRDVLASIQRAEWRPTIRALIRLHVTLLERSKIGVEGWTGTYAFTDGDFLASFQFVQSHFASIGDETKTDTPGPVSWDALRYVVGDIHYGGRVTCVKDRCLLQFLSETLLSPANCGSGVSKSKKMLLEQQQQQQLQTATSAAAFAAEQSAQQSQAAAASSAAHFFRAIVDELADPASVTGVQPLSIKAHQTRRCAAALQQLRDVQPRESAVNVVAASPASPLGSGAEAAAASAVATPASPLDAAIPAAAAATTPEAVVLALIHDVLERHLPSPHALSPPAGFNTHTARPLDIFFGLEAQRYRGLLIAAKDLLHSVAGAIEGTSSFTEERSETMRSLFQGLTPRALAPYSWSAPRTTPSPRSLTAWLASLNRRCRQIQRHFAASPQQQQHAQAQQQHRAAAASSREAIGCGGYWIGGFFNPQGFVQAVRQECCRIRGGTGSFALDRTEAHMEVVGTGGAAGGNKQQQQQQGTGLLMLGGAHQDGGAGGGGQQAANAAASGQFDAIEQMPAAHDGSVWLYDLRLEGCVYDVAAKRLRPLHYQRLLSQQMAAAKEQASNHRSAGAAAAASGSASGGFSMPFLSNRLPAVLLHAVPTAGAAAGARSAGAVAYSQFIPAGGGNAGAAAAAANADAPDGRGAASALSQRFVPAPPSSPSAAEANSASTPAQQGMLLAARSSFRGAASASAAGAAAPEKMSDAAQKFFAHCAGTGHVRIPPATSGSGHDGSKTAGGAASSLPAVLPQGQPRPILIPLYRDPERTDAALVGFVSVMQDEPNPAVWAVRGACVVADEES